MASAEREPDPLPGTGRAAASVTIVISTLDGASADRAESRPSSRPTHDSIANATSS